MQRKQKQKNRTHRAIISSTTIGKKRTKDNEIEMRRGYGSVGVCGDEKKFMTPYLSRWFDSTITIEELNQKFGLLKKEMARTAIISN